jgi:hypothetical protein
MLGNIEAAIIPLKRWNLEKRSANKMTRTKKCLKKSTKIKLFKKKLTYSFPK